MPGSQPRPQQQPLLDRPAPGEQEREEGGSWHMTARTCSLAHLRCPWGRAEITGVTAVGWHPSITDGTGGTSRAWLFLPKGSCGPPATGYVCNAWESWVGEPPPHRLSPSSAPSLGEESHSLDTQPGETVIKLFFLWEPMVA